MINLRKNSEKAFGCGVLMRGGFCPTIGHIPHCPFGSCRQVPHTFPILNHPGKIPGNWGPSNSVLFPLQLFSSHFPLMCIGQLWSLSGRILNELLAFPWGKGHFVRWTEWAFLLSLSLGQLAKESIYLEFLYFFPIFSGILGLYRIYFEFWRLKIQTCPWTLKRHGLVREYILIFSI